MNKLFKVFLIALFCISGSLLFVGCNNNKVLVVGVDFYQDVVYSNMGDEFTLDCKVYPSNASNKKVSFSTSNETVASVDANGTVTVKGRGEALIMVRTSDGGHTDYCRVVSNIDPYAMRWDTKSSSGRVELVNGDGYSAKATLARYQILQLQVEFIDEQGNVDTSVTNTDVTYTSSSPCISVINDKQGVIKAVDYQVDNKENEIYSDITATIKIANEKTLSITCRVYINEYTEIDNLKMVTAVDETDVLVGRDGSEMLIFDKDDPVGADYHAYLLDSNNVVKTDYEMYITSDDPSIFTIPSYSCRENNGIYEFTILPVGDGVANLKISTNCYSDEGRKIECIVQIVVQAEVKSVKATATNRKDADGTEILLFDENFSIDLLYYSAVGKLINNADRTITFDTTTSSFEVNGVACKNALCSGIITNYNNNVFKVNGSPDFKGPYYIKGYVNSKNDDNNQAVVDFVYKFYICDKTQGILVSENVAEITDESYTIEKVENKNPNDSDNPFIEPDESETLDYVYALYKTTYNSATNKYEKQVVGYYKTYNEVYTEYNNTTRTQSYAYPTSGISKKTIVFGHSANLYAYALGFDNTKSATQTLKVEWDSNLITLTGVDENGCLTSLNGCINIEAINVGQTEIKFIADEGVDVIEYTLTIFIPTAY